jgi:hypothetical protein
MLTGRDTEESLGTEASSAQNFEHRMQEELSTHCVPLGHEHEQP